MVSVVQVMQAQNCINKRFFPPQKISQFLFVSLFLSLEGIRKTDVREEILGVGLIL